MHGDPLNAFLRGAASALFLVAALFFIRFWRQTRDRLHLRFGIAFTIMALNQIAIVASPLEPSSPVHYLVRLAAFLVILWAIIAKNRA